MAAKDHVSPNQFKFKYQLYEGRHTLNIVTPDLKRSLGWMQWRDDTGELEHIMVNWDERRRGIATTMWTRAHQLSEERGITPPRHSPLRTKLGDAWAKSLGDVLPRKKPTEYDMGPKGVFGDPTNDEIL